ncbi:MAG TPA: glycosyltransferase [Chthoniobacteraceae bacterium]|nr:glycosyltransferase [Chthoniobacteraceae bacterium]
MRRVFKHEGFEELRGTDACTINRKACLAMPVFTSKGELTIEGKCVQHRKDMQTWPDLVCKLDGTEIGRIALDHEGEFIKSFNLGQARGRKGLKLQFSFDYDGMPPLLSMICRLKPRYRRTRRYMLRAMGRDVHLHKITLDGRLLADFTHGSATFLREFSLQEMGMGMNIIGFFQHEFGIGESARCSANSARAAGIPMALVLANIGTFSVPAGAQWSGDYREDNPHPVNLFHLDAPQIKLVSKSHGADFMKGRYNIGYWAWELPEFPDYSLSNMDYVDEIWVPSEFVRQSMAEKSPVPVLVMPHSIEFKAPTDVTRAQFGLPADDFLFLIMYDINSSQKRKNPQAAIRAFKEAFPNPRGVKLVVKTHGSKSNPRDFEALQASLGNSPHIILIDRTLGHDELRGLQNVCDCFVSLHRAEGFGLAMAECMYLGKPVIATNWSGNLQFMDAATGCLVDYKMAGIDETCGPYRKGQPWAEPDASHAAQWMKKIVEDKEFREGIAARGKARIVNDFSRRKIGELYEKRLRALACWV